MERISGRSEEIHAAGDFSRTEEGLERLDGICMLPIAVDEAFKSIDRKTEGKLLARYLEIDWTGVKGVGRDCACILRHRPRGDFRDLPKGYSRIDRNSTNRCSKTCPEALAILPPNPSPGTAIVAPESAAVAYRNSSCNSSSAAAPGHSFSYGTRVSGTPVVPFISCTSPTVSSMYSRPVSISPSLWRR